MDFISIVYTIYNEKGIEDTFVHEKLIKLCLMAEQAGGVKYENSRPHESEQIYMDHMNAGTSKLQKAALIFGSIEPDINMDAGYGKCKYGSSWQDWNGVYRGGVG